MTDLRQALLIAAEAKLKERNRWATTHCQCEACKNGNIHDSDCSVHNGDALPVGPCDCSLATPPQQQAEPTCPDCKAAVLYECVACSSNNYPPQQQAEPVLQEIEQYRMQMAGISTAAIGYWKEGDGIHPDYDTLALRDVAKLYAKYDELYKAQPEQQAEPVAWTGYDLEGMVEAFSRVIEAHHSSKHPFHNPIDMDAKMALRILRGFIPAMKAYATPPQRPWVGLTVTTILNMMPSAIPAEYDGPLMEFARAVEAKLKGKNT